MKKKLVRSFLGFTSFHYQKTLIKYRIGFFSCNWWQCKQTPLFCGRGSGSSTIELPQGQWIRWTFIYPKLSFIVNLLFNIYPALNWYQELCWEIDQSISGKVPRTLA